jgi:hypothetical protein
VSQDGREYYAVSKTLILKKRGIEIKRDHGTAYNSYEKLQVKNSGYGKTCSNRYGEFVAKETLDIVNTVLSNGAWLMSTWILTENFRKLLLKHGKSIRK